MREMKYYLESLRWLRKRERMRKAKGGSKYISVEKTLRAKWANRCGGVWRRFCVRNWQTAAACGEDFAREMGKLLLRPVKEILCAKLANCCGLWRRLCARNGQTATAACEGDFARQIGKLLLQPAEKTLRAKWANCCFVL